MKKTEEMSPRELRGELSRHRSTLRKIASARLGHLAQEYTSEAKKALEYEERLDK